MPALSRQQFLVFFIILGLHLVAIWVFSQLHRAQSALPERRQRILFIQSLLLPAIPASTATLRYQQRKVETSKPISTAALHLPISKNKPVVDMTAETKTDDHTIKESSQQSAEQSPELNRDVGRISQLLERDLRFEEQKLQAAKPPNQIVREYWEKQNHPYKDKWDELAHKIEKAGKPRDLQIETFKSWDGTQISKIDGRCYKAPDPGRTYLHQAEVRQVICPR